MPQYLILHVPLIYIQFLFQVFLSVVTGALGIGNSLPNVIEIATAIGAAATVFEIIDNVPKIDPYSKEGQTITDMKGTIEFKNVYFSYPTRQQVMVSHDCIHRRKRIRCKNMIQYF